MAYNWRRHHCWHRRRHIRVFLVVNGYFYELNQHKGTHLMEQLTGGHTYTMTIVYLDASGNPMLAPVVPDSPPTWTNTPTTPPVDTLTVSADGGTAVLAATAAGSDTINLSVTVGGKTFTATESVTISAAPQVLTSVSINNSIQ